MGYQPNEYQVGSLLTFSKRHQLERNTKFAAQALKTWMVFVPLILPCLGRKTVSMFRTSEHQQKGWFDEICLVFEKGTPTQNSSCSYPYHPISLTKLKPPKLPTKFKDFTLLLAIFWRRRRFMNCGPFQEPLAEMLHLGLGTPCWVLVSTKHFGSTPCIKRSSIPLSWGNIS